MNPSIEWMLITADPAIARYAESCGVHRIFVDMEVLGKAARQGHVDTHKATHTLEDISVVREALTTSELMVRVNPLHEGTSREVSQSIARGADRLMLPMFTSREEVEVFRRMVPGTTPITFLAETPAALARTVDWADALLEADEVHYGLNDLSLAMGLDFLFEPLAADLFLAATRHLARAGIPYGIGGIARPSGGELSAAVVLGEHVRLGSTRLILSRAFHGSARSLTELKSDLNLASELSQLRAFEEAWKTGPPVMLDQNHRALAERCFALAKDRRHCA